MFERPAKPQSTGDYLMRRWAGGIDNSVATLKRATTKSGKASTRWPWVLRCTQRLPYREAEAVGQKILSTARNATREDAKACCAGSARCRRSVAEEALAAEARVMRSRVSGTQWPHRRRTSQPSAY